MLTVFSALAATAVALGLPESHPPAQRTTRLHWGQFNAIGQLVHALRAPRLRLLFAVVFCFALGSTVLQANLAVLLKERLLFNPAAIGFALAGIGIMDMLSQGLAAPRLLPRFGERRVAAAGLLINGMGLVTFAALAYHPVLPLLVGGIALFTFGDGLFQPSASALIANAAPAGRQGAIMGANQAQQSIARMAGPLLSAWLYGWFASAPYATAALVVLVAAALLMRQRAGRSSPVAG